MPIATTAAFSTTPQLKLTDLAPGNYIVVVRTQPLDDSGPLPDTKINLGKYYDNKLLALKEGQTEQIDFRSVPYDPNAFRGTRTAVIHVKTPDGQPAKGRSLSVTRYDGHYGSQVVFSGTVSELGDIALNDISDAKPMSWYPSLPYWVSVDDRRLGTFGFSQQAGKEEFEFTLVPEAGDMAPDVKLTSLTTKQAVSLSSFRGKVVLVEFWATWCGPCQQPMSNLNGLAREAVWKDRFAIVPISIDTEDSKVQLHVSRRGWTDLNHFWSGGNDYGDFESPAARAFVLKGVPESILIDGEGRILWRGHPTAKTDGKDLKTRIEEAMK